MNWLRKLRKPRPETQLEQEYGQLLETWTELQQQYDALQDTMVCAHQSYESRIGGLQTLLHAACVREGGRLVLDGDTVKASLPLVNLEVDEKGDVVLTLPSLEMKGEALGSPE